VQLTRDPRALGVDALAASLLPGLLDPRALSHSAAQPLAARRRAGCEQLRSHRGIRALL
jgi:hypothetical protein